MTFQSDPDVFYSIGFPFFCCFLCRRATRRSAAAHTATAATPDGAGAPAHRPCDTAGATLVDMKDGGSRHCVSILGSYGVFIL
jgi:hypothetical protein